MKSILFSLLILLPLLAAAQLLPTIGIGSLPLDSDSICPITPYLGTFSASGYHPGDTVPDFTLYKLNGDSVNLATELRAGLPILLVSSSYTCPVFRGKIPVLNQVDSIYQGQLKVFIVYTPEAHPIVDVSPYSGAVWTTSQNQNEGILFEQPKTYGERKALIDTMLQSRYIRSEILVDGPCNQWWLNYGPAPNNATLILPSGVVFAKHDWLHNAPLHIFCDIDSLLSTNSGLCTQFGSNGNFTFALDADSMAFGHPGDVLDVHGTITNHSATDNVILDIAKMNINIPAGWQTALCADICYPTGTSQTQIVLAPSQVQPFTFYFYTDAIPAIGNVLVGFKNNPYPNNADLQRFYGSTVAVGLEVGNTDQNAKIFPHPFSDRFSIQTTLAITEITIYDLVGKLLVRNTFGGDQHEVQMKPNLAPGSYLLRINDQEQRMILCR